MLKYVYWRVRKIGGRKWETLSDIEKRQMN